jgi:hypothetical protein
VYPDDVPKNAFNFEVFMTPDDFVRSLSPGVKQPDGVGLDKFYTFNQEVTLLHRFSA